MGGGNGFVCGDVAFIVSTGERGDLGGDDSLGLEGVFLDPRSDVGSGMAGESL